MDNLTWIEIFLLLSTLQFIRYLIIAGGAHLLFWVWLKRKTQLKKLQSEPFDTRDILRSVLYSFVASFVFGIIVSIPVQKALISKTQLYEDLDSKGWLWLIFSFVLLIVIHDTYFYWMHRILHHRKIYKIFHKVHHNSNNPTAFAALSFHPLESIFEFAFLVPLFFLIPLNKWVLLVFAVVAIIVAVIGHLGFEVYPEDWEEHKVLKWVNRTTYHNDHHVLYNKNFGYYFCFWDSWMGTLEKRRKSNRRSGDLKSSQEVTI